MNKLDRSKVYEYLTKIPKGKVVTYAMIGDYLGNPRYARAVGSILHINPDGEKYPCYKVVNAAGRLSPNYIFGGIEAQRERLERDGVEVVDYKVDLPKYRWEAE